MVGGMSLDPRVDIGHVHLKVADLDRSLAFYRDVLGFDVMQRHRRPGGVPLGRRLPPPPRPEHVGVARRSPPPPARPASTTPRSASPTGARSASARRVVEARRPARRRVRPRRLRGDLPPRPGRERRSSSTATAREEEWPRTADGGRGDAHRAARPAGSAERGGLTAKGYARGTGGRGGRAQARGARARRRRARAGAAPGGLRLDRGRARAALPAAGATSSIRTSCSLPDRRGASRRERSHRQSRYDLTRGVASERLSRATV